MATAVATAVVRLEAIEVAVEVTTDSMPPMSLVMRDCTSPVRVRVKNAIDCRCRCVKTSVRSRCMTCWPTLRGDPGLDHAERGGDRGDGDHADRRARPAACRLRSGSALSMTARSRNGEAIATMDDATMMAVTIASCARWAVKSRPMRRSDTSRACAFSAAVTVCSRRPRLVRPVRGGWCGFQGVPPSSGIVRSLMDRLNELC